MVQFAWDNQSYIHNEQREFLISGEFHYFRVPKQEWVERLLLLKRAGGNCVATYIPWILHEPEEGRICFGDHSQRDLEGFLLVCKSLDMLVVCRPGPYQYSELKYDGLPGWLCEDYPEILARDIKGNIFRGSSVSYLHPLFLKKVKAWYAAVAPILAKYMLSQDGPIAMVQIDNELMGIHEWFGGWDYHPVTMGFGCEDGRYTYYLKRKYSTIHALNVAYQSQYDCFSEVTPVNRKSASPIADTRVSKDYQEFYFQTISEYVSILYQWLREAGVDCQIVHNSANPNMDSYFLETVKRLGKNILLGADHYYNLDQDWNQNNPTPQYAINVFYSNEMLRLMGYPATVFELPGGSFSDWPPLTPEDMLCCYMTNAALGMKGLNYYIFTGGPNPEGVSHYGDIYDYGASIGAFGEIRPTYDAQLRFGRFLKENSWLAGAERETDFYVGLDWEQTRSKHYDTMINNDAFTNTQAWSFMRKGILTTAFCASYSCNMLDLSNLENTSDMEAPLFVATSTCMPRHIQSALIQFVRKGGKLLLAPVIPTMDENFEVCTILGDFLQAEGSTCFMRTSPVVSVGEVHNVLMNGSLWIQSTRPPQAQTIATEEGTGSEIGWKANYPGGGSVIWLGFQWKHSKHEHTAMLRYLLAKLGCTDPLLRCSNPNVWTSLRRTGERRMLFVMNLFSAKMVADLEVRQGDFKYQRIPSLGINPMEIQTIELHP